MNRETGKEEAGEWVNKIPLRQRKKAFISLIRPGCMRPTVPKWGADTNTVPPQRGRQEESETEGGIRHQQAAVSQAGMCSACIMYHCSQP